MRHLSLFALAPFALLTACGSGDEQPTETATPTETPTPDPLGSATLNFPGDRLAGSATLTGEGDTVSVTINLTGIPDGTHAVHLHTTGSCEGDDFAAAGPHLNPDAHQHGIENPAGAHLGDLPNVVIAGGRGSVTTALRGARADVLANIFDADGTAVVVHADPDDNMSDPAGNAGDRIACGVLAAA